MSSTLTPPLRGDGNGQFRVQVVGNSGSGKSTLGKELSRILNVPLISLDTLFWTPNWGQTPRDEFRAKVFDAMAKCEHGWIVDGNYTRRIGPIVEDRATDVIWLDPPLILYLPRLCYRTFLRLIGVKPPCSTGYPETISEVFFSKKSIVWWCISQHWAVRKREGEKFALEGIHVGGNRRRIGGWGSELVAWRAEVEDMFSGAGNDS